MKLLCKPVAESIDAVTATNIAKLKGQIGNDWVARLLIKKHGEEAGAQAYINSICKQCEKLGIAYIIDEVGSNKQQGLCDGALYVKPFPELHGTDKRLYTRKDLDMKYSCTAEAVVRIAEHYNLDLKGKHCVIFNRTSTVGRPLMNMLLDRGASVSVFHSESDAVVAKSICKDADYVITATAQRFKLTEEWVKKEAVIFDISYDCDKVMSEHCTYITNIGSVTTSVLLEHLVAEVQHRLDTLYTTDF